MGRIGKMDHRGMKISLVVVCHHSSRVLPGCVESFRRQAAAAGVEPEVIVVEHSEDDGEALAVEACRPDRLMRRPNGGYAAGLNAGICQATGELLFLANPDIEFLDGSVGALVDAVVGGRKIAGPQLLWDLAGEVILPIPDDPSPTAELARTLRRRWPRRGAFERRVAASWRVWTAEQPCEVPSLRGPLMALSRDTARWLGPLDEDYFLYYEETEWLWRARRRGASLVLAPGSRVVHRWGHATKRRDDNEAIAERSRLRFFARNYPAPLRALLNRLAAPLPSSDDRFQGVAGPDAIPEIAADVWLLSIVCQMEPSVGCLGVSTLPPAARELSSSGRWYAVAARRERDRWRPLGSWMWERG